jgi:hypothetical protein
VVWLTLLPSLAVALLEELLELVTSARTGREMNPMLVAATRLSKQAQRKFLVTSVTVAVVCTMSVTSLA